ncbi:hypothetical protein COLO4_26676 [Corchorus olitorius]|uniref:Uncharacterized protein n=1 Tax=Corchorus olitorius TaxID=93759 RepID=A0A1R3HV59_9ROSI|nr:hypothetical protein COLO4_26676 [Corchorus olitorius]
MAATKILASISRYPFLRKHSTSIGSILSLAAGAAKEAADQLGLFPSAGASARDAVADLLGVLVAAIALSLGKMLLRPRIDSEHNRRVLPV